MLTIKQSATLFRRVSDDVDIVGELRSDAVTTGPLIFVACGLMAYSPAERLMLWIRCASGDFEASDAELIVRQWFQPGEGVAVANLADRAEIGQRDAAPPTTGWH